MATKLKVYKKYSSARKAADGQPVLRVGDLYVVGIHSIVEIAVIEPSGTIAGHVIAKHLARLGNANWATADERAKGNPNLFD